MTVGEALIQGSAALAAAGVAAPAREARLLLAHARGEPSGLLADRRAPVPAGFWTLLERRCRREPMAHISGRQGFWTLDLEVSAATLIPRADSETLIEAAIAVFPDPARVRRVLDLGTGTGALLLAALGEFPLSVGVGVDRAPAAAALARRNAAAHGLAPRAVFAVGHWGACVAGGFDLVLANPPYVEADAVATLMPEVARFEPRSALDGGPDGLDAYRAILPDLPRLLAAGGVAVLEVGDGQARAVAAMANRAGLCLVTVREDLGGVARAVVVKKSVGSGTGCD
jgi:release factor glutamine methyltransferase